MGELVTAARFYDVPEALCAQSALESSGIGCHLGSVEVAQINWHWMITIDGIPLMVLEEDRQAALAILGASAEPEHFETGPESFWRRPAFNGSITAALLITLGYLVPFWLRRKREKSSVQPGDLFHLVGALLIISVILLILRIVFTAS